MTNPKKLINVQAVPHKSQRYPTAGDWYWQHDGSLQINVSQMKDEKHMWLLALHEIIEAILCKSVGITDEQVTYWDMTHIGDCEPGEIMTCPYFVQHRIASDIESILSFALKVDWSEYEKELEKL